MSDTLLEFSDNTWGRLKKDLRKIVGDTAYNNWIKQLTFLSYDKDTISLSVPTKFLRDWIVNNYADKIKGECYKYNQNVLKIKIVVKPVGGRIVPGTARIFKNDDKNDQQNVATPNFANELAIS